MSASAMSSAPKLDERTTFRPNNPLVGPEQLFEHTRNPVRPRIHPTRVAHQVSAGDAGTKQLSAPDLARNGLIRNDRDADFASHERLENLDVFGLHHDARLDALLGEESVQHAPGVGDRFEEHERLLRQILRHDAPFLRERMRGMRDQQHLFLHRGDGDQLGFVDRQRDEPQIDGARANFLEEALRRAGDQFHFDRRVLPPVFLQQRGKDVHAHRHAARKPQRAAEHLLALPDERHGFLDVAEDAMAELHERFACRRDADAPAHAQEHRLVHLLLEEKNLPADGRLRHVQLPPGARERSGFGHRLNDFQLPQIHQRMISDYCMIEARLMRLAYVLRFRSSAASSTASACPSTLTLSHRRATFPSPSMR
jgi:hypothetical protein